MAKGIRFQPQSSNPLPNPSDLGLWVNNNNELIVERGGTTQNITQVINNVESGLAATLISKIYTNNTGSTIPINTVVYSPAAGQIAVADGTDSGKFKAIGITTAAITNGNTGTVALMGIFPISGLTHNTYAYLGVTPGAIVTTAPSSPSGFNLVRLGVVEGNNIILQIQHTGVLN
jgi:hypothetical protein